MCGGASEFHFLEKILQYWRRRDPEFMRSVDAEIEAVMFAVAWDLLTIAIKVDAEIARSPDGRLVERSVALDYVMLLLNPRWPIEPSEAQLGELSKLSYRRQYEQAAKSLGLA